MQRQQDLEDKFDEMQKAVYNSYDQIRIDPDTGNVIILTEDELETLQQYLVHIQTIGEYNKDNTPLDTFDSSCHDQDGGVIQNSSGRYTEEDLVFMINTSEQVKRPIDMLMFLGEYFKEVIW